METTEAALDMSYYRKLFDKLKNNAYFGRLGKTFKTKKNYYFLDTGTGKIAQVKKGIYEVLKAWLENDNFDSIFELNMSEESLMEALKEIGQVVKEQHILSAPLLKTLTGDPVLNLDGILENEVQNITLEITQKCNLRCKYCIYNEFNPNYREFGHKDMEMETAKKAIDFLYDHSSESKEVFIGFYGGEPLINFKGIKECVAYGNEKFKNHKKVSYSMTTNATLLNEEIADYLVQNEFHLTISLDGPEEIQNENRVYINGKGTFNDAIRGIKNLLKAYKKADKRPSFGFNAVTSGPNYKEKYEKMNKFFKDSEWLPSNLFILSTMVDYGPEEMEYFLPQSKEEKEYISRINAPLYKWDEDKIHESPDEDLFSAGEVDKGLNRIHKRLICDQPIQQYGMNGCCVPGNRRVFVTVAGEYYPCEKVGDIPSLGNVNIGFDMDKIKKYYVHDFINEAKERCKNCWAVNLCSLCYAGCYDKNGVHFSYRNEKCLSERFNLECSLVRYHSIYEEDPKKLEKYNSMDIT